MHSAELRRAARPETDGAVYAGPLRELARDAGLSMLEAHEALIPLFERKLIRLLDGELRIADLEALAACLDPS